MLLASITLSLVSREDVSPTKWRAAWAPAQNALRGFVWKHQALGGGSQTINALGKKARDGTLSIDEMAGGTFTISNGGVYGSLLSTPIINPPQSAILGMHSINPRAAVRPVTIGDT